MGDGKTFSKKRKDLLEKGRLVRKGVTVYATKTCIASLGSPLLYTQFKIPLVLHMYVSCVNTSFDMAN